MGRFGSAYRNQTGPHSVERHIAALAGRQHGVVSARQLTAMGLSKWAIGRWVRAGRLHRLYLGVYAVGHVALTAKSRYLAAVMACGPRALLSHRSAGALWGLLNASGTIEVTAGRSREPRDGLVVHRSRLIHPDDIDRRDVIPVTSVARTLVDLAEVLNERRLASAVHEAEVLRLFDLTAVEAAMDRMPGRRGRHRLRRVLADYRPEPRLLRSDAERRVLAMCSRYGLPVPQTNVTEGGYELDFLWPDAGVALEFDGAAVHHTRRAFHADRRKDRALAARGLRVLRATWPDLENGQERLARDLSAVLTRFDALAGG